MHDVKVLSAVDAVARRGQVVTCVTERCLLTLGPDGLVIEEVAPGLDMERDVLSQMEFSPRISENLKIMDPRCFRPGPMGITLDRLEP